MEELSTAPCRRPPWHGAVGSLVVFSQVVPVPPWEGVPQTPAPLELVTSCLTPGKHSLCFPLEMGKFMLVSGKVCL